MKKILKRTLLLSAVALVANCRVDTTVSEASMAGIEVRESGLAAEQVFVTNGVKSLETRAFSYGQKIYTNFKKLEGFTTEVVAENEVYYPEMSVYVISEQGDTLIQESKLLGGTAVNIATETLHGHVILATPIHSGMECTVNYRVFDTKSDAELSSTMAFTVEKDKAIRISENGLSAKEAYLYDQDRQTVISDAEVKFEQNLLLDFQGLKGYTVTNGQVSLGIAVKVTGADGTVILKNDDYFAGQFLSEEEVQSGVGSTLAISKGQLADPVTWEVRIWDKLSGRMSDRELTANIDLNVK